MDRGDITDRLPNLSLDRVPGIGGESEPEPPDSFDEPIEASDTFDEPTEASDAPTAIPDTRDEGESEDEPIDDRAGVTDDEDEPEEEETPSRREQARKALLGVSLGGAALAVLAAAVRRLLGEHESEEDEGIVDVEPEEEQPEPAPDAEAVATVVGLAFQVLVRRLVGEDELEA